jgi:hypothetical protein
MSSESLRKGDRWRAEIGAKLAAGNFGILCLTRDNLTSTWIHFEAGALSKNLEAGRVTALLIGVAATDVVDPLSQFQHTQTTREDILRLVRELNAALAVPLDAERLTRVFEREWPRLEKAIAEALNAAPTDGVPPAARTADDMIPEILEILRSFQRDGVPSSRFSGKSSVASALEELSPKERRFVGALRIANGTLGGMESQSPAELTRRLSDAIQDIDLETQRVRLTAERRRLDLLGAARVLEGMEPAHPASKNDDGSKTSDGTPA